MAPVRVEFRSSPSASDPASVPVLIIGQASNLLKLSYDQIKCKFGTQDKQRVSEETLNVAIQTLVTASGESVSLWLNQASIAVLPGKSSRHNTPSRSHAVTKLVRYLPGGSDEVIVVVTTKKNVFASGCAIARAFPIYTRKTTGKKAARTVSVEFIVVDSDEGITEEDEHCLQHTASAIRMAARIVDTPCNEMTTSDFLEEVRFVAADLGIEPVIIAGEDLKAKGLGGIYGVGKAATHPPALAVLSHTPAGATKNIAWVGKGIVYDTGGLSMKTKTTMPGMKRDCGGAAAVLASFRAAVSQGFKENLHAILCLAENAVGPLATRPDDVHTLYSGRTVEINNTDAEGRLVLGDGVSYAVKDLNAGVVVDMATLTGAQAIATGKYHAAVLTNREEWEAACTLAGTISGDLVFPVPYCPELHFSEFGSAIADMKNSVADRNNAQVSCAGLFIGAHMGFDYCGAWVHIDMATPVHSGERATGYGVALLMSLFGDKTTSDLLNSVSPWNQK